MPGISYTTLLIVATFAGVGGGNFASSMTNINAYYPQRLKGWALGVNAGGGNLGVPVVQLVGLLDPGHRRRRRTPAAGGHLHPADHPGRHRCRDQHGQPDPVPNSKRAMRDVSKERHTWIISLLYIGTFGSFIGFSFAFGQVLQMQFKADFATPAKAASLTFLGPLLGSLVRPVGGALADRFGGARRRCSGLGYRAGPVSALIDVGRPASGRGPAPICPTGAPRRSCVSWAASLRSRHRGCGSAAETASDEDRSYDEGQEDRQCAEDQDGREFPSEARDGQRADE